MNPSTARYTLTTFGFLLAVTLLFFFMASNPPSVTTESEEEAATLTAPNVSIIDPARGAEEPTVTIVEFGDFACGACAELDATLNRLLREFPDDLRIVWKNMPNQTLHPDSLTAALAAGCADQQGEFWIYHDELFLRQGSFNEVTLLTLAENLGLNMKKFTTCLDDEKPLPRIQKTTEEGLLLQITATPTIFIGEKRWTGAVGYGELKTVIEELIPS